MIAREAKRCHVSSPFRHIQWSSHVKCLYTWLNSILIGSYISLWKQFLIPCKACVWTLVMGVTWRHVFKQTLGQLISYFSVVSHCSIQPPELSHWLIKIHREVIKLYPLRLCGHKIRLERAHCFCLVPAICVNNVPKSFFFPARCLADSSLTKCLYEKTGSVWAALCLESTSAEGPQNGGRFLLVACGHAVES